MSQPAHSNRAAMTPVPTVVGLRMRRKRPTSAGFSGKNRQHGVLPYALFRPCAHEDWTINRYMAGFAPTAFRRASGCGVIGLASWACGVAAGLLRQAKDAELGHEKVGPRASGNLCHPETERTWIAHFSVVPSSRVQVPCSAVPPPRKSSRVTGAEEVRLEVERAERRVKAEARAKAKAWPNSNLSMACQARALRCSK